MPLVVKFWDNFGRVCTSCGEYKAWEFYSSKNPTRDKHRTDIHTIKQPKCKVCAAADTKAWNDKNKDTSRERYLQLKYGMSENEYNARLLAQNNQCPLCEVGFSSGVFGPNSPVVDHCHSSGKVRGILCNECNRGLGYFHDNKEALIKAASYLTGTLESEEGACSCPI